MNSTYYRGIDLNISDFIQDFVAVVGSRKASMAELEAAYNFSYRLAKAGKIVVSGLAKGIDAAAHQGAVDAGGVTIAIVNTPPFQPIYPKENQKLALDIQNSGGIIYPYLTKALENKPEEKGLSQFSKRLIERDALVAYLCPTIVTVKDTDSPISGGTRWAFNYGEYYKKRMCRIDTYNKVFENPEFTKSKIWWETELNPEDFLRKLD